MFLTYCICVTFYIVLRLVSALISNNPNARDVGVHAMDHLIWGGICFAAYSFASFMVDL